MKETGKDIFDYSVKRVISSLKWLEEYMSAIHCNGKEYEKVGILLLQMANNIEEREDE